ncbi:sigma-70 family RNA polymerase sigma factor [Actinomadura rayongensis]|uniref:sigma-70 family RNA polymerase sigma factor n=1 Tax=Actinomadura rayongensis TaxID=1429076 RepID=UPI00301BC435
MGFEEHRPRLRAVAYRVLGSLSDADDAVQETWLRFRHADVAAVENLGAWLTTVVTRVCLDVLRTRERRGEEPYDLRIPDPIVDAASGPDPEHEALLTDAVGLALMVVLETLAPPERVAFVLHDMFAVPFEDIAPMIERTPAATRQLASRARRRVRDRAPAPDRSIAVQREVVDGFFAAARAGDLDALVAVLDPGVVLRSDGGAARAGLTVTVRGARDVAGQAVLFGQFGPYARPALVNGAAGVTVVRDGRLLSIMAFTVVGGRIVAIDVLADPARLG